jgi:hypothetical protein
MQFAALQSSKEPFQNDSKVVDKIWGRRYGAKVEKVVEGSRPAFKIN